MTKSPSLARAYPKASLVPVDLTLADFAQRLGRIFYGEVWQLNAFAEAAKPAIDLPAVASVADMGRFVSDQIMLALAAGDLKAVVMPIARSRPEFGKRVQSERETDSLASELLAEANSLIDDYEDEEEAEVEPP